MCVCVCVCACVRACVRVCLDKCKVWLCERHRTFDSHVRASLSFRMCAFQSVIDSLLCGHLLK